MTIESNYISKKIPESTAADFLALKEEALAYIQKIAGNTWTDYNAHDPGVTIIEQLSYAINELSYRTSFDIKDILAENNGDKGKQEHFFSPRQILSTNPVSIDDFRKVIIDVDGIKNAWMQAKLFGTDGAEFYKDEKLGTLAYLLNKANQAQKPVQLLGLYDLLLEFENDVTLGDLNNNNVQTTIEITDPNSELFGFKAVVLAEYPYWDSPTLQYDLLIAIKKNLLAVEVTPYRKPEKLRIHLVKDSSPGAVAKIQLTDITTRQRKTNLEVELQQEIDTTLDTLATTYKQKIERIWQIVNNVNLRIHAHRNLCEDFVQIRSLQVKEIALCMKINLDHAAKQDSVLANIYHGINQFLSPQLIHKSLSELMEKQVPVDKIFEGPALNYGFITDDQLNITDRRNVLYVSDFINVISDVSGVKQITELEIAKKEDGEFVEQAKVNNTTQWHLRLEENDQATTFFIPRLNTSRSTIKFYKNDIPLPTNTDAVNQLLKALETSELQEPHPLLDLSPPVAGAANLAEYTSIQNDFPITYGINEFGLSSSATDLRKAQVHQLKGYLLVFEQLLSNYMAQLANVNQLFSLDTTINNTYFTNPLYEVPRVEFLLHDFIDQFKFDEDPKNDDPRKFREAWIQFTTDKKNNYQTSLSESTEEKSVFLERRNRFLDHLMARFSEQFSDYASIIHSIDRDLSGEQLIEDKALLLKDYPIISANRGKGFNYRLPEKSDTLSLHEKLNLTGLEIRMARLLGIDLSNFERKGTVVERYLDKKNQHRFRIKDYTGEIILNSEKGYGSDEEFEHWLDVAMQSATIESNFQPRTDKKGRYYFNVTDSTNEIVARSQEYFTTEAALNEEILMVLEHIRKTDEKLRVVEHILLRPKLKSRDKLLPVSYSTSGQNHDCDCCDSLEDPYSFIISVVLPSWPMRFRSLDFRRHVEKKIRMETPAHIFPKICWVNLTQINEFEVALHDWKKALGLIDFNEEQFIGDNEFEEQLIKIAQQANALLDNKNYDVRKPITADEIQKQLIKITEYLQKDMVNPEKISEATSIMSSLRKMKKLLTRSECLNKLIETMSSLRNVYPEATLYDCQESNSENPIALNKTVLGTFKPIEKDE